MIEARRRYHLVGIGGTGMSGLASVLLAEGADVSGSDLNDNHEIAALRDAGALIHVGHDRSLVDARLDGVIVSSAIAGDNEEILAAQEKQVPIVRRIHALRDLLVRHKSVGIAGTHGKTTTTAMLATVLRETGADPSYLVGAQCPDLGGNAHLGRGEWFVAEIDESDGLFTSIRPNIAVLNNIGRDHLHTYADLEAIVDAFALFLRQAEKAVLNIDDPIVRDLATSVPSALTVGLADDADLRATRLRFNRFITTFDLTYQGETLRDVTLSAPGVHNVRNALCALGGALLTGLDLQAAAAPLARFVLPHRRFELLEENGVTVVDDYAHLPEEIDATLDAIRTGWPDRRIIAIFQPHRYTRTQSLGQDFGRSFDQADAVIVTDIYPASETPVSGVSSTMIVEAIGHGATVDCRSIPNKDDVISFLEGYIRAGDFIISFGAGDIWTVTEELSCFLTEGKFLLEEPACSPATE